MKRQRKNNEYVHDARHAEDGGEYGQSSSDYGDGADEEGRSNDVLLQRKGGACAGGGVSNYNPASNHMDTMADVSINLGNVFKIGHEILDTEEMEKNSIAENYDLQ